MANWTTLLTAHQTQINDGGIMNGIRTVSIYHNGKKTKRNCRIVKMATAHQLLQYKFIKNL